ncbi:MAG: hypothetical protein UX89_C0001G0075 [Parcubacteria group bacterium GW2011_GWA2_47_16]|nr:MAG: hypothetical protein UX89_C0001G0075 [Parcubacteria group bacterium GW2011_GWA2_47_16]
MHPAEEVHAGGKGFERYFVGMERESQTPFEKCGESRQELKQAVSVSVQNDEIVRVPHIMPYPQFALHEAVELIHVDIHKKLTRQIPEWKSLLSLPLFRGGE